MRELRADLARPGDRTARRPLLTVLLTVLLVTIAACTPGAAPQAEVGDAGDPGQPAAEGLVVLPVIPVGGDLAEGRQTLDGALAAVDDAAEYGAGGIRLTADLRWLCTSERCRTAPLDPIVERATELGLRVYLHVNSSPSWLDERGRWYAPEGEDAERWAALFAQFVARYGTDVVGYEVWNEPNIEDFWAQGPDPEAYADLLKASYLAAKAENPDVTIIGAVLSNNDLGYMHVLSGALADRGGSAENSFFYDQLGVHPYAGGRGEGFDPALPAGSEVDAGEFGVKDMTFLGVERLRAQVAEDEGIWRDVVIGEFGYDTTPGAWYSVAEPVRAEYMARALQLAAEWDWLRGFTPYTYVPRAGDGFGIPGTATEAALAEATAELDR